MDDILQDSYFNRKEILVEAYDRTYLARVVRYDDDVVDLEDIFTGKLTLIIRSAIRRIGYVQYTSRLPG